MDVQPKLRSRVFGWKYVVIPPEHILKLLLVLIRRVSIAGSERLSCAKR